MAGISVSSKTHYSVTLYVSSLDTSWTNGTRDVEWYLGSAGGGIPTDSAYYKKKTTTLDDGVSSGGEVTFTALKASTTYGVYCMIWYGDTLLAELQGYVTTDDAPNWVLVTSDFGELDLTYTPTADGYWSLSAGTLFRIAITFADSGIARIYSTGSVDTIGYFGTSPDYDEDNGVPYAYDVYNDDYNDQNFYIECPVYSGTTYYIWVRALSAATALETSVYAELSEEISITKWDWSASNGSNASASETYAAYSAIVNETATTNFSHLVWNDMVDKIYEIILASTNWWDEEYASYYNTKFNSEPYELTADMFNSLRNNIELVGNHISLGYTTGIGKVNPDDKVYGDYFLTLANYINSCIDNL